MSSRTHAAPALTSLLVLLVGCAGASSAPPSDGSPTRTPADPAEVTAEVIEQSPRSPLLQGRIAGVQVIPTPGGVQVRIRGQSTIHGDSEPLYIVGRGSFMAEMLGRAAGCSGGRGGSMHLFDRDIRFLGGNAT